MRENEREGLRVINMVDNICVGKQEDKQGKQRDKERDMGERDQKRMRDMRDAQY